MEFSSDASLDVFAGSGASSYMEEALALVPDDLAKSSRRKVVEAEMVCAINKVYDGLEYASNIQMWGWNHRNVDCRTPLLISCIPSLDKLAI